MKDKAMDWKMIGILSAFGLIMGLLSLKGFTQKIEPFLWLLFTLATALVVSKNIESGAFFHGLLIGLFWGAINALVQSVFFDSYIENNPQARENFDKVTFMPPRYFVLITGPVIGLVTGAVLGGLSLLLKKVW